MNVVMISSHRSRAVAVSDPRESINWKDGVGSIEKQNGSSVWGFVFSVSERDLDQLDRREGVLLRRYTRGELFECAGERIR